MNKMANEDQGLTYEEALRQLKNLNPNIIQVDDVADNKKYITVAIIGLPNAGKSSLVNLFVGEKVAGVSSKIQTTRSAIKGITISDNVQIIFIDSPGVIDPKTIIDNYLVEAMKKTLKDSELLMILMDIKSKHDTRFQVVIDNISKYKEKKKILVINKIDTFSTSDSLNNEVSYIKNKFGGMFEKVFEISVIQNKGIDDLLSFIRGNARRSGWLYPSDQVSESSMKFCAAEITREKLFEKMDYELPYSILVETESYKEEEELITIVQTIYVSRDNHKAMVIGKGAQNVKEIGIQSRIELEAMLGKRVNLLLHVKTKERWDKNEAFIKGIIGKTGS